MAEMRESETARAPTGSPQAPGRRAPIAEDEGYDIRIARDGTWWHEGSPIGRLPLVKLFASVLRRDAASDYWLITPAERGRITVEDAPFVAIAVDIAGQGRDQVLTFRTNLEHERTAGPDHPIRVAIDPDTGEPSPYIRIADGPLEALIARPVFYELAERAIEHEGRMGVWSKGAFFPLDETPRPKG
jgi:hypothetical protein